MGDLRKTLATRHKLHIASLPQIKASPWFAKAKTVAIYISQSFEFPMQDIFELCVEQQKTVVAPAFEKDKLIEFRGINHWPTDLVDDQIFQPNFGKPVEASKIDVFFVPLVAFDRSGKRLGRNGGYYDRLFAQKEIQGVKVGVGFEFQDCLSVPVEDHDVSMDYILTEKKLIKSL